MKPQNRYHHGNLRTALLEAAQAQLARHGHEAMSLRALAAAAGVAPSAPYAHFKSREDLLADLVAAGSADLAARFQVALESPGDALHRLELACHAYLAFAHERPEMFRLIFIATIDWEARLEIRIAQSKVAYPIFEKLVAAVMPGADTLGINAATITIWAAIHGMAMLKLSRRLDRRYVPGQTDLNIIQTILKRSWAS